MDWLKSFVNEFFFFVKNFGTWFLDAIFDGLFIIPYFFFDGFLTIVHGFFISLDTTSTTSFSYAAHWANLPPELIYIVNAVDLPQALSIVSSGILVRMLINLIPATLTRI
jgi:hypothetical protein